MQNATATATVSVRLTTDTTHLSTNFERDNCDITLVGPDGNDLASWSGEDCRQMFGDGFFSQKNGLHESVLEYYTDLNGEFVDIAHTDNVEIFASHEAIGLEYESDWEQRAGEYSYCRCEDSGAWDSDLLESAGQTIAQDDFELECETEDGRVCLIRSVWWK